MAEEYGPRYQINWRMAGVIVGALALGFTAFSWLAHGWIEAEGELTREKLETIRQENRADNEALRADNEALRADNAALRADNAATRAYISEVVLPLAREGAANAAKIEKFEDDLESDERLDRLESLVDQLSQ